MHPPGVLQMRSHLVWVTLGESRHTLDRVYKIGSEVNEILNCIQNWATDLGLDPTPELTFQFCKQAHRSSLGLLCYTGDRLQASNQMVYLRKIYAEASSQCWSCSEDGSLLHMFWACPLIKAFWIKVGQIAQRFSAYQLDFTPSFFLLHYSSMETI